MIEPQLAKIGARQKVMMAKMIRYGNGTYLPRWYLSYADELVLKSLEQRGLVSKVRRGGKQVYQLNTPEST